MNCHFDPFRALETVKLMKQGLEEAGLKAYLMIQPLIYHVPDAGRQGFIDLPEFPFGMLSVVFVIQSYFFYHWQVGNTPVPFLKQVVDVYACREV